VQLVGSFFLIILLMGGGIGTSIFALNQVVSQSDRFSHTKDIQDQLLQVRVALLEQNFQITELALLNRYQNFYDYTHASQNILSESLAQYKILTLGSAAETNFVNQLMQTQAAFNQVIAKLEAQLQVGNVNEVSALLDQDAKEVVSNFDTLLTKHLAELEQLVVSQKQAVSDTSDFSQILLLVGGIGFALVAVLLAVLLSSLLARRFRLLGRTVIELGKGNLQARVRRPGSDQLGRVALAFNQMADQLLTLVENINSKRLLGEAAGKEINAIITQLASSVIAQQEVAMEQATALYEVTSSMEELGAMAGQIAQRANAVAAQAGTTLVRVNQVKNIAEDVNEVGQQGHTYTKQSVDINRQVEDKLLTTQQAMEELVEQSGQIETVVGLISSVASETHLLALNAAIEAASAGLDGDRFKVVASQIRNLAGRSKQASVEVAQLVSGIRNSVLFLQQALQETILTNENNLKLAAQVGDTMTRLGQFAQQLDGRFGEIVVAMSDVTMLTEQIRAATSQQDQASVQITQTMQRLNQVGQDVASSNQQLAETTNHLRYISSDMLVKVSS
jgi:methyl-accepting chemotaxis protein